MNQKVVACSKGVRVQGVKGWSERKKLLYIMEYK